MKRERLVPVLSHREYLEYFIPQSLSKRKTLEQPLEELQGAVEKTQFCLPSETC